jgi:hypothetical protein
MSKSYDRLVSGLIASLQAVSQDLSIVVLNVIDFREAYRLSSMSKRSVAKALGSGIMDPKLTTKCGLWSLAEVDHPMYALVRLPEDLTVMSYSVGPNKQTVVQTTQQLKPYTIHSVGNDPVKVDLQSKEKTKKKVQDTKSEKNKSVKKTEETTDLSGGSQDQTTVGSAAALTGASRF